MKMIDRSSGRGGATAHSDPNVDASDRPTRLWVGPLPTPDMPHTRVRSRRGARTRRVRALVVNQLELNDGNTGYDPYDRGSNLR